MLQVSENKVLRKLYGPQQDEVLSFIFCCTRKSQKVTLIFFTNRICIY
jgi:hypothetical protein